MAAVELDIKQVEKLESTIKQAGTKAESVINSYLRNQGGNLIKKNIQNILPQSGRHWKGKVEAAANVDPFKKTEINLGVKVHTKANWHYLYFPDDGSNTVRHYGNQQFMLRGAEESTEEISENIINNLLKEII